jgi:hypothetical protein
MKIALFMHCIDLAGHAMFRAFTEPTLNKYMQASDSQNFLNQKKKTVDDYLIQKDYFKGKKGM